MYQLLKQHQQCKQHLKTQEVQLYENYICRLLKENLQEMSNILFLVYSTEITRKLHLETVTGTGLKLSIALPLTNLILLIRSQI